MYLILWIAGIWALLAGRMTLMPSLRLRGSSARAFGAAVLAYALLIHPHLVILRLKLIPLSGEAAGGNVLYSITEVILIVAVLLGLSKLALSLFPPSSLSQPKTTPMFSTSFLIILSVFIIAGISAFLVLYPTRSSRPALLTMGKPMTSLDALVAKLDQAQLVGIGDVDRSAIKKALAKLDQEAGVSWFKNRKQKDVRNNFHELLARRLDDAILTKEEYDDWQKYYGTRDVLDLAAFQRHVLDVSLASLKTASSTLAKNVQLMPKMDQMSKISGELGELYMKQDLKKLVDYFEENKSVYSGDDKWTYGYLDSALSHFIAPSYEQLKDNKKAAYYYALDAKAILKSGHPEDGRINEYLSKADQLDPGNAEVSAIKQEISTLRSNPSALPPASTTTNPSPTPTSLVLTKRVESSQQLMNLYKAGKYAELVQRFDADKGLYLVNDLEARRYCPVILPMAAESYQKIGQPKKAAYYFAVMARIAKELGLQQSVIDSNLQAARRLDPNSESLKKIEKQVTGK